MHTLLQAFTKLSYKICYVFIICNFLTQPTLCSDSEDERRDNINFSHQIIGRTFEDFLVDCSYEEKVLIFGAGHHYEQVETSEEYPKNFYLIDCEPTMKPDLCMSTDVEVLPKKFIEKFDVVVFEGFDNYDLVKSFTNVYKLLKTEGIFLVQINDSEKEKKEKLAKIFSSELISLAPSPFPECEEHSLVIKYVKTIRGRDGYSKIQKN